MKRLLGWLPAIGWAGLIFLLSSLPTIPAPEVSNLDKVGHFVVYLVLGALLATAAGRSGWPLWAAVVLGVAYGATDEVHQMFVPGRSPSVQDWLADAAGVCAGVYLHARLRARRAAGSRARRTDPNALRA